jgi:hypothetical protein
LHQEKTDRRSDREQSFNFANLTNQGETNDTNRAKNV